MREVVERVRFVQRVTRWRSLWKADAPEFLPIAKEEEVNLDESEEEADDDGGYYESAEWKAKVAAALQRKLDKVDISGKEE